jgi:hypothetical protein
MLTSRRVGEANPVSGLIPGSSGNCPCPDLGLRMMHAGKQAKVYPLAEGKDLLGK